MTHKQSEYESLLSQLVNIPSPSTHLTGINKCLALIKKEISPLKPSTLKIIDSKKSPILIAKKIKKNCTHILFNIHIDTVFDLNSSFNSYKKKSTNTATGPGVIDAKGGCVILLHTLKNIEKENLPISWSVIINSDEEIGTPYSKKTLISHAKEADIGIVFEPCLENGDFIDERPVSSNICIKSKGKEAHAGRHPEKGINAIHHLIKFLSTIQDIIPDTMTLNIGTINGGVKENIIPGYAEAKLNCRCFNEKHYTSFLKQLNDIAKKHKQKFDASITVHEETFRPSNPLTSKKKKLFELLKSCGKELNTPIKTRSSFGVCDGNILASAGIPVIDTFGPLGKGMHTEKESIHLPSLIQKIDLITHFIKAII
ncbi:hypothetical protein DID78_03610 [Candidatus Marinamargulisbacteria bacterium SCGC AG-343-D04]|nr:hypothetical protein DID78_03610 [Candidatus Marinamargulisbacteria bacterium SCGC AG-343-D04]